MFSMPNLTFWLRNQQRDKSHCVLVLLKLKCKECIEQDALPTKLPRLLI